MCPSADSAAVCRARMASRLACTQYAASCWATRGHIPHHAPAVQPAGRAARCSAEPRHALCSCWTCPPTQHGCMADRLSCAGQLARQQASAGPSKRLRSKASGAQQPSKRRKAAQPASPAAAVSRAPQHAAAVQQMRSPTSGKQATQVATPDQMPSSAAVQLSETSHPRRAISSSACPWLRQVCTPAGCDAPCEQLQLDTATSLAVLHRQLMCRQLLAGCLCRTQSLSSASLVTAALGAVMEP